MRAGRAEFARWKATAGAGCVPELLAVLEQAFVAGYSLGVINERFPLAAAAVPGPLERDERDEVERARALAVAAATVMERGGGS